MVDYREAGVDRAAAARAKNRIEALVAGTYSENVIPAPGSFGGLFRVPAGMDAPVLVSSADGVGTKLKVAIRTGRHESVGRDLVNHCVNDILVEGARPLFFLDYIGMGSLAEGVVEELVAGMSAACKENDCALLGGETAEMPDFYQPGDYDLAGFVVGVVEDAKRLGPARVKPGDALIGLAADGFHTNGYSLLRRILFDRCELGTDDLFPGLDDTVGHVLLRVHRSYYNPLWPLLQADKVSAMAHITGGGIPDNLSRVIPPDVDAVVSGDSWVVPPEFRAVQEEGNVPEREMFHTFNMGVGMILVVAPEAAPAVEKELNKAGERAWLLGSLAEGSGQVIME